ncbi:hypothetical protein BH10PSE8_BH10PSE8_16510 [soil metagenome]
MRAFLLFGRRLLFTSQLGCISGGRRLLRSRELPSFEPSTHLKLGAGRMSRCFVIQPFDGADFDNRYDDVIAPAIKAAGLDPYRVDRDPSSEIPIDEIADGIRNSVICVADITLDNPNVWFELGYAISANKQVVLICGDARQTKFPFDVQHRTIIKYKTSSKRDFENLEKSISDKLAALMQKAAFFDNISNESPIKPTKGLKQHEIVAIAVICDNIDTPDGSASIYAIQKDMESALFTKLATTIALKTLQDRRLIEQITEVNHREEWPAFRLTPDGWNWALENQHQFVLKRSEFGKNKSITELLNENPPF